MTATAAPRTTPGAGTPSKQPPRATPAQILANTLTGVGEDKR